MACQKAFFSIHHKQGIIPMYAFFLSVYLGHKSPIYNECQTQSALGFGSAMGTG